MRLARPLLLVAALATFAPAVPLAGEGHAHHPPAAAKAAAPGEACEHGVKKSLCTRCNPKLSAVFQAKGDWCAEHERPESQCVLCHPELAKKGIR